MTPDVRQTDPRHRVACPPSLPTGAGFLVCLRSEESKNKLALDSVNGTRSICQEPGYGVRSIRTGEPVIGSKGIFPVHQLCGSTELISQRSYKLGKGHSPALSQLCPFIRILSSEEPNRGPSLLLSRGCRLEATRPFWSDVYKEEVGVPDGGQL